MEEEIKIVARLRCEATPTGKREKAKTIARKDIPLALSFLSKTSILS